MDMGLCNWSEIRISYLDQAIYVLHATSDHLRKMPPLYELEITEDGNVKVIGVSRH